MEIKQIEMLVHVSNYWPLLSQVCESEKDKPDDNTERRKPNLSTEKNKIYDSSKKHLGFASYHYYPTIIDSHVQVTWNRESALQFHVPLA